MARDRRRESQLSRDRETIRRWADDHGVVPVRETSGDAAERRFQFVRTDEARESTERLEWDAFFDEFDEGDQVVVYRGEEASEPFEIADRDEVIARVDDGDVDDQLLEGETVTSELTETTVVESVVEELTVESELVDRALVDQRVIDVDLLRREVMDCELVEDHEVPAADWFDSDRYLGLVGGAPGASGAPGAPGAMGTSGGTGGTGTTTGTGTTAETKTETETGTTTETGTGTGTGTATDTGTGTTLDTDTEYPFHAEFDVEEAWSVTRETVEQFTVESHVTDSDITEADTIEDHDIDVGGLHHSIAESGIFGDEREPDEIISHYDVESELVETDRVQTTFTREMVTQDEIVDRKRLRADIAGGEVREMELVSTEEVAVETEAEETGEGRTAGDAGTETTAGAGTGETTAGAGDATGSTGAVTVTDGMVGKPVVDASGDEVGMVSDVRAESNVVAVDAQPGIADRIMAALGWGDADDDYTLEAENVERVTNEQVELKESEQLPEGDPER